MTVSIKKEVEVKFVKVEANIRHEDEDMAFDFPLREGNTWKATIELETGQILDWPGTEATGFYIKVVDEGSYHLLDENKEVVVSLINDYVPNELIPGEYGDYMELQISETGKITNWPTQPSLSDFESDEF